MWDERIQELIRFQQKHGHCKVPDDSDEYEDLSAWIRQIRAGYAGDEDTDIELTEERIADLQKLGVKLYLLKPVKRGKRRLRELIAYKRLYGHHYRGPSNSADFPKLTAWLKELQAAHTARDKEGEEVPILINVQLSQLEKIGFNFNEFKVLDTSSSATRLDSWNRRLEELKEFKRAHGHFRVPQRDAKYASLYYWMVETRVRYRKFLKGEKTQRINANRIAYLKAIGFDMTWLDKTTSAERGQNWNRRLEELKDFNKAHGHFRVPASTPEYKPLYDWLRSQQEEYMKLANGESSTQLTSERITKLNRIGFYFGKLCFKRTDDTPAGTSTESEGRSSPNSFDYWLGELRNFKMRNGHCRVPENIEEYKSLYSWTSWCRQRYKNRMRGKGDAISDEEILHLKDVGFEFPAKERSWADKVNALKRFREIHGHFLVSRFIGKYKSLGLWVYYCQLDFARVKRRESAKLLTSNLIRQLHDIGFNLDGPFADDEIWNLRIEELKRFIQKYGHYKVPSNGKYRPLCEWLQDIRNEYNKLKKGERSLLTKDRVRQFLEIEMLLKDSRPRSSQSNTRSHEATERRMAATVTPEHRSVDTCNAFQPPDCHNVARQSPHAAINYLEPKEMPIPAFIDDLIDDVDSMLEKRDHWERDYAKPPGGGRPNQFWLEIGDRDGIDFF